MQAIGVQVDVCLDKFHSVCVLKASRLVVHQSLFFAATHGVLRCELIVEERALRDGRLLILQPAAPVIHLVDESGSR